MNLLKSCPRILASERAAAIHAVVILVISCKFSSTLSVKHWPQNISLYSSDLKWISMQTAASGLVEQAVMLRNQYNDSFSRFNFEGRVIRIGYVKFGDADAVSFSPAPIISRNGQMTLQVRDNIDFQFFSYVQDALNFTAHLYSTNYWIYFNPKNNSWEGLARLIHRDDIDYSADGTYFLYNSVKNFRFLLLVHHMRLSAYFPPPAIGAESGYKDVILHAIGNVWWCVVILLITIICILKYFYGIEISSAIILALGNFSQQGVASTNMTVRRSSDTSVQQNSSSTSPSSHTSFRIIFYVTCICSYVINAHICAVLISRFSMEPEQITTLQDLVDLKYSFGLVELSYLLIGKSKTEVPESSPASESALANPSYDTSAVALKKILANNKYVLLSEMDVLQALLRKNNKSYCDTLRVIELKEGAIKVGGFVKRGSNLSDPINFAMLKMWNTGIAKRFLRIDDRLKIDSRPTCPRLTDDSIHIAQLKTPSICICAGLCLSIVVYIYEVLQRNWQLKREEMRMKFLL